MLCGEEAEGNGALQEWREGAARCAANRFALAREWGDVAPGAEWMLNWVAEIKVGVFKDVQVKLKTDESVCRTTCGDLIHQCALPNEGGLIKVNESIHPNLVWRDGEARVPGGATGVIVHAGHDQARFKSRHIERLHTRDAQRVVLTRLDQRIPDGERRFERHKEFEAKVSRVSSARDAHGDATNGHVCAAEEGEIRQVATDRTGEHVARAWSLQ